MRMMLTAQKETWHSLAEKSGRTVEQLKLSNPDLAGMEWMEPSSVIRIPDKEEQVIVTDAQKVADHQVDLVTSAAKPDLSPTGSDSPPIADSNLAVNPAVFSKSAEPAPEMGFYEEAYALRKKAYFPPYEPYRYPIYNPVIPLPSWQELNGFAAEPEVFQETNRPEGSDELAFIPASLKSELESIIPLQSICEASVPSEASAVLEEDRRMFRPLKPASIPFYPVLNPMKESVPGVWLNHPPFTG